MGSMDIDKNLILNRLNIYLEQKYKELKIYIDQIPSIINGIEILLTNAENKFSKCPNTPLGLLTDLKCLKLVSVFKA